MIRHDTPQMDGLSRRLHCEFGHDFMGPIRTGPKPKLCPEHRWQRIRERLGANKPRDYVWPFTPDVRRVIGPANCQGCGSLVTFYHPGGWSDNGRNPHDCATVLSA